MSSRFPIFNRRILLIIKQKENKLTKNSVSASFKKEYWKKSRIFTLVVDFRKGSDSFNECF
jgi:hypothetical protein